MNRFAIECVRLCMCVYVCIKCEFIRADWHDNRVCELSWCIPLHSRVRLNIKTNRNVHSKTALAKSQHWKLYYKWYRLTDTFVDWIRSLGSSKKFWRKKICVDPKEFDYLTNVLTQLNCTFDHWNPFSDGMRMTVCVLNDRIKSKPIVCDSVDNFCFSLSLSLSPSLHLSRLTVCLQGEMSICSNCN